ncbi:MAG: chloride channel protein [Lachnospiraceae bacterium]|nr:chloride channel protein [Lachnospiraceae bacterium]
MNEKNIIKSVAPLAQHIQDFIKWIILALISGVISGLMGSAFSYVITGVTFLRNSAGWLVFLLPAAGLLIVYLYHKAGQADNSGTNICLTSIRLNDHIPPAVMPLIFISSAITHLFGGSSGREGAALQLGGSMGQLLGDKFGLSSLDKHVLIMCTMSGTFSAVFGTPMAAAIFSMEVVSIGVMYYSALVPCVLSSLTASYIARLLGLVPEAYAVGEIPALSALLGGKVFIAAIAFAGMSVLFCIILHGAEHLFKKYIPNPFLRAAAGGAIVIALMLIFRTRDYLGTGTDIIKACFTGARAIPWFAFILKPVFTAATLGSGFKGGEIVPSFFTGATLGYVLGSVLGIPLPLAAACGMIGVFCGVTNCPITSLLISFELFGFSGMPYFLITVAVSYALSGYYGLYHSQKIIYSKYSARYINRDTNPL